MNLKTVLFGVAAAGVAAQMPDVEVMLAEAGLPNMDVMMGYFEGDLADIPQDIKAKVQEMIAPMGMDLAQLQAMLPMLASMEAAGTLPEMTVAAAPEEEAVTASVAVASEDTCGACVDPTGGDCQMAMYQVCMADFTIDFCGLCMANQESDECVNAAAAYLSTCAPVPVAAALDACEPCTNPTSPDCMQAMMNVCMSDFTTEFCGVCMTSGQGSVECMTAAGAFLSPCGYNNQFGEGEEEEPKEEKKPKGKKGKKVKKEKGRKGKKNKKKGRKGKKGGKSAAARARAGAKASGGARTRPGN